MAQPTQSQTRYGPHNWVGLIAGLIAFTVILILPPPDGLDPAAWHTAAVTLLMAIWWISEAVPIPATALLPLVLFPSLKVVDISAAATPYAHKLVFLFMGGFMIALAMQRWNLHKRIALTLIGWVGTQPRRIVGGFMLATGFLSMWVSNTATTLMMLPIAISVIQLLRNDDVDRDAHGADNFAIALMLAIAYAASIGGMGTLIGTPPNAFLAGFMAKTYGVDIGFGQWMLIGVPLVIIMLPITWLLLTRVIFPFKISASADNHDVVAHELHQMGPMASGERIVLAVFCLTALLWIFRPPLARAVPGLGLDDATIAMAGALVLFVIPVNFRRAEFVLNWEWAKRLPWDVLILFGGGLSLASAIKVSGLAEWIGNATGGLGGMPILVIVLVVIALMILLTELTSNTATTATFLPILASVAVSLGENPYLFSPLIKWLFSALTPR